jgi:hypothetical protein
VSAGLSLSASLSPPGDPLSLSQQPQSLSDVAGCAAEIFNVAGFMLRIEHSGCG